MVFKFYREFLVSGNVGPKIFINFVGMFYIEFSIVVFEQRIGLDVGFDYTFVVLECISAQVVSAYRNIFQFVFVNVKFLFLQITLSSTVHIFCF